MKEGFIRPKEFNRRFSSELKPYLSPFEKVNVNCYETRRKEVLEINGVKQTWHSLKGGIAEEKKGEKKATFEVWFNPESNEWLKTVPPGTINFESLTNTLRSGAAVGREVLEKSGLTSHALNLQQCTVKSQEGSTYGFITPHIGPTEAYIKDQVSLLEEPEQFRMGQEFLKKIHATAFNLSTRLYLESGIWTSDPNPGNVVVHFDKRGATVSLIDFMSWPNRKYNGTPLGNTLEKTDFVLEKSINALYKGFKEQADLHKIPFSRELTEVEETFSRLLPQKKEQLRNVNLY